MRLSLYRGRSGLGTSRRNGGTGSESSDTQKDRGLALVPLLLRQLYVDRATLRAVAEQGGVCSGPAYHANVIARSGAEDNQRAHLRLEAARIMRKEVKQRPRKAVAVIVKAVWIIEPADVTEQSDALGAIHRDAVRRVQRLLQQVERVQRPGLHRPTLCVVDTRLLLNK